MRQSRAELRDYEIDNLQARLSDLSFVIWTTEVSACECDLLYALFQRQVQVVFGQHLRYSDHGAQYAARDKSLYSFFVFLSGFSAW